MKKFCGLLAVAALSAAFIQPVVAQQPQPQRASDITEAQATPELLQKIQDKMGDSQTQQQLLFEKLHGITEFQQWIHLQAQMQELQQAENRVNFLIQQKQHQSHKNELDHLGTPPTPAAKPTKK